MKEALFICCSGFQLFTALWMKYHHLKDETVDFFIDSFIKGYEDIAVNLQQTGLARKVYYGKCDSSYYVQDNSKIHRIKKAVTQFWKPQKLLEDAAKISGNYSKIYVGMCDEPRRLLCSYLSRQQKHLPEIVLFDEGTGTYSEEFNYSYYKWWHGKDIKGKLNTLFYRDAYLKEQFRDIWVFEPKNMVWKPYGKVRKIDKLSIHDESFRKIVNTVFGFEKSIDVYTEKYIYLGNYFAKEIDILNRISEFVGKNNIIVKRHPRERREQFDKAGYKCNNSDSVMWEVILMNMPDIQKKVIISIASSALLNTFLVFDMDFKVVSVFKAVEKEGLCGTLENTDAWRILCESVMQNKDKITICSSFEELNNI